MPIERITIFGTGLIGASVGLALREHGFRGRVIGWDRDPAELQRALSRNAVEVAAADPLNAAAQADLVVLAGPVSAILDWLQRLAPILRPDQLVTDVGSVKQAIVQQAAPFYGGVHQPGLLPGHPMAGKEVSGAANADADLFSNAVWLFADFPEHALAAEWGAWVERFGSRTLKLDAERHDELCAWVSHLPQMVGTALSALLEDHFGDAPDLRAIGGRALREMTRLGASPYSMWRDVAHNNEREIAEALHALEQRLAHLRENLKTPELREEFERANEFRRQALPTSIDSVKRLQRS